MQTTQNTANVQPPAVDLGIKEEDRKEIAHGLSRLLADTYLLYLKTHNFHWNVTGPQFHSLHEMFEEQYTELAQSVQETRGAPEAQEMVRLLVEANETVVRTAREAFPAAERASDEATADLLTERMGTHEKTAWMLRSTIQ
ncbi:MAG: DNA starvation/stationary phase protection protein [Cyanobacteria bacterium QS_7_48_42]|nr:MAG: DNA starvation/stationary phase protection protein [Cyanobacteria bacterium QS_7_48_42]